MSQTPDVLIAMCCLCVGVTVTGEIRGGHVLDRDLLEEGGLLAARVATDHPSLLQPLAQPAEVAVTNVRVGQQVTAGRGEERMGLELK